MPFLISSSVVVPKAVLARNLMVVAGRRAVLQDHRGTRVHRLRDAASQEQESLRKTNSKEKALL